MRRFLTIAIPIITLALFIVIMLSASFLKKPMGQEANVSQLLEDLIQNINKEDWDKASYEVNALDQAWKKVLKRIQFSSERDEINNINTDIARLRGSVSAMDKASSLMELEEAYNHWNNIGN